MVEVYNEAVYDLLAAPEYGHEKMTIQKQGKDVVVQVSSSTVLSEYSGEYLYCQSIVGSICTVRV